MQSQFSPCVTRTSFTVGSFVFIWPNSQNTSCTLAVSQLATDTPTMSLGVCLCVFVFSSASDWTQNSAGTLVLSIISLQFLSFFSLLSVRSWSTFIKPSDTSCMINSLCVLSELTIIKPHVGHYSICLSVLRVQWVQVWMVLKASVCSSWSTCWIVRAPLEGKVQQFVLDCSKTNNHIHFTPWLVNYVELWQ